MTGRITTRRAGPADLDVLMANMAAGLATYTAFTPHGWTPPDVDADREHRSEQLADPACWALIALVEDRPVGHVMFTQARRRSPGEPPGSWGARSPVPGLAHLSQLFVLPDWWGRGVSPVLHDAVTAEMRARGYRWARLFTPSLNARARRFYERRGWAAVADEFNDDLDLQITEYRLALSPGDPDPGPDPDLSPRQGAPPPLFRRSI